MTPWLFLLPGLLVTLLFTVYPFVNTAVLSFTDAKVLGGGAFTGLANFSKMLDDPLFWVALRNSALYVVGVVPFLVILPLLLALLVQRHIFGMAFFRAAFFTPVVASIVVISLIWTWLLDSRGLVNNVLSVLHVISSPIPFLTDQTLLLISAMLVTIWRGLGYYMIVYLAALANVPRELHEAAEVDGAGAVRRFFSVTVPIIRPTMVLVGALSAVAAFRVFSEVYLLSGTSGGPAGQDTTLVMLIRQVGTGLSGNAGYASALSLVLFALTLGLLLVTLRLNRSDS
ncbi:sugar ABC transporter permease [Actinocrispum sp. NPDC049592]|uniref:carbohydrate ABC transporter permease n=1 Tax=Actinocrispum sp. NPDC049592 TaxID=3154835 RepID=UPI003420D4B2